MKICPTCGRSYDDSANICSTCGVSLNPAADNAQQNFQNAQQNFQQGFQQASQGINQGFQSMGYNPNPMNIGPRNIVVAIILSIVTCGLYGIYWMVKINDELMSLVGEQGTSGIMVVILSIVTCGIYELYWMYKMGQRVDTLNGVNGGNTGILYLILSIFGLGIVNYCLIQDAINKRVS